MKRIIVTTLGWIARIFGLLLAVVTLILLFTGEFRGAGLFAVPSFALVLSGSNLIAYGKKQAATAPRELPKE